MSGAYAVIGALALASVFGLWRQRTDGRVKLVAAPMDSAAAGSRPAVVPPSPFSAIGDLGEHATIVQFSATVCAPCRAAKVIATDVAATVPGVVHLEINAEENIELVKEFGIMRTPTILVLDGQGRLSARISGVPRKDELLIALDDRRFEDI